MKTKELGHPKTKISPGNSTKKKGRGRPRKSQTKEFNPSVVDSAIPWPISDPIDQIRGPVLATPASFWSHVPKGRRVERKSNRGNEKREDSGFPSTGELGFPSMEVAEETSGSPGSESTSGSSFDGLVIPGPIPDLNALLNDQSVSRKSDFFSDIPDDLDSCRSGSESISGSFFDGFVIPGPIPDLDALLTDQSLFRNSDFFSDIPEDLCSY